MKARQRGQRIASRGKSRPARRAESKTGGGESISSAGDFDENRPKSVCGSACTFAFGVRKRLRCLRAVRLKPDSNDFRMRPYAPYAVPLKGKRPKRSNSQKRCIKCIRLLRCPPSPTLHWLFDFGGKVHNWSSPTFDPMPSSNALRPCLNPTGEGALPSLFGNHPISSGFLRRIFSRTIMAIPTTEKDRDKPSSRFLHIYASVCTSYAAACSPYALFRLEQEARRE